MINYFLGIDAGATKSIARLTDQQRIVNEVRGGQASLSYDLNLAIANVQSLCVDLLNQSKLDAKDIVVACGAAGAGNPEAAKQLEAALMQLGFAHVLITTDAQTSLIGAGDGKPLAMIAVGTGSVAMRLSRDGSVKQFGGWGLAVGDEGSGAAIGKSAVRSLLWELDIHGTPQTKLSRYVVERVGRERPAILRWLRQAGPMEYAELAPAVFDFLAHCELARKIAKKTVNEVEVLIRATRGDEDLPIAMLGGLADCLSQLLSDDLKEALMTPIGTALDGACKLAQQHQRFL